HREHQSHTGLDESELVWAQLEFRADEVALQLAGPIVRRDPRGSTYGIEPATQLLADVGERPVRGADRLQRACRLLCADGTEDDDADPDRRGDRDQYARGAHQFMRGEMPELLDAFIPD